MKGGRGWERVGAGRADRGSAQTHREGLDLINAVAANIRHILDHRNHAVGFENSRM